MFIGALVAQQKWHRVAPNAATPRWFRADAQAPGWLSRLNTLLEGPSRLLPLNAAASLIRWERPGSPFSAPSPLSRQMSAAWGEVAPLYAGERVAQIADIRPAAEVLRDLGKAFDEAGT